MKLYNVMENIVRDEVDRLIKSENYKGCCCVRCRADMIAFALNQLPARYVVTETGEVMCKIESTLPQNQVDVLAAVTAASKIVENSPRHT